MPAVQDQRKASWALWVVLAVALAAVAAAYGASLLLQSPQRGGVLLQGLAPAPSGPLADYGSVPDFLLTEASGRMVARADLAGSIWVADFIFTRCAGSCPMMTSRMAELSRMLGAREDVRLVSFTVDPERDTPEVLARYARMAGAQADRWLFLTGAKEALHGLARSGFHLGVEDQAGNEAEPILHSTRLILIDRAGTIRGYYDAADRGSLDRLASDLRRLP